MQSDCKERLVKGHEDKDHEEGHYLKDEKPIVIKVNSLPFEQVCDLREVAFSGINVIVGGIVPMSRPGDCKLWPRHHIVWFLSL